MRLDFNEGQIDLLQKIGFAFDVLGDLTDEQIFEIDEKVESYFAQHGITQKDEVNAVGLICESILDLISDLPE